MISRIAIAVVCCTLIVPGVNAKDLANRSPVASTPAQEAIPPLPMAASPERISPIEQESLSARDQDPGQEVVGGALNNQQITYILIALATAVIVLILH